jgi:3-methylcrotonyl-CoA carboxylase alpha subunit
MNGPAYQDFVLEDSEARLHIRVHPQSVGWRVDLPGGPVDLAGSCTAAGALDFTLDGAKFEASVVPLGAELVVVLGGVNHRVGVVDVTAPPMAEAAGGGRLTAPMPGKITQVLVEAGADVVKGAALLVLEAMKMEHTITAPTDGTIERVRYAVGDLVDEGTELIAFIIES